MILHKNIQECPILDKNIQYTLSKKVYKKKKTVSYQEKNSSLKEWTFSRRHLDRIGLDIVCLTNDLSNTTHWWGW